jgi:dephospho-CoA kinase
MTLKSGITGGIGSGKSTVAKIFALLGVPVYYADDAARAILHEDHEVLESIRKLFGDEVLVDGKPDRKRIAAQVFNDKEKLGKLNAIVHPAVRRHFEGWLTAHNDAPYILKEAAILFESGTYKELDKIITVVSPEEARIARVMKRDNVTAEEVRSRIANQMSDEEKIKLSHFIIHNNDSELIIPQVLDVHHKLMPR